MRLRSDFWVSAYLRRCALENIPAVLRRRGAAEAGAIFVVIDRLNNTGDLYSPAPQSLVSDHPSERLFVPTLVETELSQIEAKLAKELHFDPDLWIIDCDEPTGRHFLDMAF
jgi:hypothetical protein